MLKLYTLAAAALLPFSFAVAQQTLTLTDGSQYQGHLVSSTGHVIVFRDMDGNTRRFSVDNLQNLNFSGGPGNYGAAAPAGRYDRNGGYQRNGAYTEANGAYQQQNGAYQQQSNEYNRTTTTRTMQRGVNASAWETLPAGTQIAVRTNETISARSASGGRTFGASIAQDVVDNNGRVVIPQGSDAQLVVRNVGNGVALDLQSINVNGQVYTVNTEDIRETSSGREGLGTNRRTGEYVGGGAVLGTLLGAIAGGGRGAAIGALAGGAAGAGAEVLTKGDNVRVPAESVLTFRLDAPMQLNQSRY